MAASSVIKGFRTTMRVLRLLITEQNKQKTRYSKKAMAIAKGSRGFDNSGAVMLKDRCCMATAAL